MVVECNRSARSDVYFCLFAEGTAGFGTTGTSDAVHGVSNSSGSSRSLPML